MCFRFSTRAFKSQSRVNRQLATIGLFRLCRGLATCSLLSRGGRNSLSSCSRFRNALNVTLDAGRLQFRALGLDIITTAVQAVATF